VQDVQHGKIIDLVFNYGTFDYDDDFYFKFAMGKLDYKLSVSRFGDFQKEYIDEMRGIEEQTLLLNHAQRIHLWGLLQANYLPENQTYRYDFFYDNCSTRARDIILLACQLSHQYPVPDSIDVPTAIDYSKALHESFPNLGDPSRRQSMANTNTLQFTYTYPCAYSFRQAIDQYLKYQPWSDFGIDVALGLPCDRTVLPTQSMFLPDSLKKEFHFGLNADAPIVKPTEDLLFNENQLTPPSWLTPFWTFFGLLLLLILSTYRKYINWPNVTWLDRIVLFLIGMIGLLVVFLWFITDHHGTVNNLNILWAHPLWIYLVFDTKSPRAVLLAKSCGIILALTLIGFFLLPQQLPIASIPLMLSCALICAKVIVKSRRLRLKPTQIVTPV